MQQKRSNMLKHYFLSFIEESVMNSEYQGFIGGRIEVYDEHVQHPYAAEEISYLTTKVDELEALRDKYDFKDVNKKTLEMIKAKINKINI